VFFVEFRAANGVSHHAGVLAAGTYIVSAGTTLCSLAGGCFTEFDLTPPGQPSNMASALFETNLDLTPVPEPTTLTLFGTGLLGMGVRAWRRKKDMCSARFGETPRQQSE
jgi:hypothetical protein